MAFSCSRIAVRRLLAVPLALLIGMATAVSVRADDPSAAVSSAQQALAHAKAQQQQMQAALADAQQLLAMAQQQLAQIQAQVAQLDAEVASDTATVNRIDAEITADRATLAKFVRNTYEAADGQSTLLYVVSANDISGVMQRATEIDSVTQAGDRLVARVQADEDAAQKALTQAQQAQTQAHAARQQAATEEAVVAADAANAEEQAQQANAAVNQAQQQLSGANQAYAQWQAAQAAARARNTVFPPVGGPLFTIDTDLTQPSGENAATLNAFLSGTALAGLGQSYMNAEQTYHVSARYLVAHSILESAWGTSWLAQNKHNLFGYGADDANPLGDAKTFASFDACIMFVAKMVSQNYLTPGGSFYHGPTLRGMNVCYASDPMWAVKIARIANTIPLPGQ